VWQADSCDHTISLVEIQGVYDRAYQHEDLMGTDLDPEYDATTKQRLLAFAAPLTGKRVLDLGTGIGSLWDHVPPDVIGFALDPSLVGIVKTKSRHPELTVSVSIAESIPYKDGYFDAVIAADTIEHTLSPAQSLKEICRVLRPGGHFCGSLPTRDSLRKWGWNHFVKQRPNLRLAARLIWVLIRRTLLFGRPDFQPLDRDKDISEWLGLIGASGLTVVSVEEWPSAPQIPIVYLVHARRMP
jgi:SAM-dependent methyltransferase